MSDMPTGYLSSSGIESCLIYLSNAYPAICQLITLPESSAEGRTQRAVRIGKGSGANRLGVLLIGGLHARELVNPDALVGLALKLCQAYTSGSGLSFGGKSYSSSTIKVLVDAMDVFFFPLVNPDGRTFVQAVGGDPWWRKNRRPIPSTSYIGVDLNRNFDFLWDSGIGTSSSPSDYQIYKGTSAFSESETRNVKWMFDSFKIKGMMDVHSYSQLLLYPWGDDNNQSTDPSMNFTNHAYDGLRGTSSSVYMEYIPSADLNWYQDKGAQIKNAIAAVRGRSYLLEQSIGLYPTTATSDDYAYSRYFSLRATRKVKGYTLETGTEFQPAFPEAENVMNEAMVGSLEFCISCLCVAEEISAGHGLFDRLDAIRKFRDEVMMVHPRGRKYVGLLSKHTVELLALAQDKSLRKLAQDLLEKVSDTAVSGKPVSDTLLKEVNAGFDTFSKKASPQLKKTLEGLRSQFEGFRGKSLEDSILSSGGKKDDSGPKQKGKQTTK